MRPGRRPADPFAVLGVPSGATRAEIRRAYRRRALAVHPDVSGAGTTSEMADLNRARDEALARAGLGASPSGARETHGDAAAPSGAAAHRDPDANTVHRPTWDDYWAAWNDLPRRG